MKLLNDFADESKRKEWLDDLYSVINKFGEIASIIIPRVKGDSHIRVE